MQAHTISEAEVVLSTSDRERPRRTAGCRMEEAPTSGYYSRKTTDGRKREKKNMLVPSLLPAVVARVCSGVFA